MSPSRKWLPALLTAAVVLAVNALRFPLSVPWLRELAGGRDLFDLRPGYGQGEALELLVALGPSGRSSYLAMLWTVDLVLPALFTLVLVTAMSAGRFRRYRWLGALPGASDYLENVGISALLVAGPPPSPALVAVASALTVTKFVLYGAAALFAAAGFVRPRAHAIKSD